MFPGPAAVNVRKTDVYGRGLKQHLQIRMAQHSETGVLNSNRESRKSNRERRNSNRKAERVTGTKRRPATDMEPMATDMEPKATSALPDHKERRPG